MYLAHHKLDLVQLCHHLCPSAFDGSATPLVHVNEHEQRAQPPLKGRSRRHVHATHVDQS